MKNPTLKEVQEHFKNVKNVRSQVLKDIFTLQEPFDFDYQCFFDYNGRIVWSEYEGYAEIIKKPQIKILDYSRKRLQITVPLEIYDKCKLLIDREVVTFKKNNE